VPHTYLNIQLKTKNLAAFRVSSSLCLLCSIKDKMWLIFNKNSMLFVSSISHATIQKCNFPVLWLFLATFSCYLNCLSVRSLHTHYEQWQILQHLRCPYLPDKQNTFNAIYFGFLHNCSEADCFQATPTLLMAPYYAFINFLYQLFSLNMASPFPFPHNAGTDVLNDWYEQKQ